MYWPIAWRLLFNQPVHLPNIFQWRSCQTDYMFQLYIFNGFNVSQLSMRGCFYLQLLILQQSYHQCPNVIHCLLITHEGEQVVENHNLEVCEHRVASVPGAAASNLQHTIINPSHINNTLSILFHKRNRSCPGFCNGAPLLGNASHFKNTDYIKWVQTVKLKFVSLNKSISACGSHHFIDWDCSGSSN